MDAQKIAHMLYESFANDDLCEHPEIVDDVEDLADEYEDTKAENDKLRELVEGAVEAASLDDVRDWPIGHRLRLIRQARELGIEVDDGDGI